MALEESDAAHLLMDEFFIRRDDALDELRIAMRRVRGGVLEGRRGFWFCEGVVIEWLLFLQHANTCNNRQKSIINTQTIP